MAGDGGYAHDFLSQAASSSAASLPIDCDGWALTPPRLRGGTGSGGRGPVAGLGAPHVGPVDNLDLNLNSDCAVVSSYPNLGMYSHILQSGSMSSHGVPPQRARSDGVLQRPGRPPRQVIPPVRAQDLRGKAVAVHGRVAAGSSSSGSSRQRQAAQILRDDVGEEDEEEEDDITLSHHQDDSSDDDSIDQDDSSDDDSIDQDDDSSDEEKEDTRTKRLLVLLQLRQQRLNNIGMIAHMFGTYYFHRFMDKGERRILKAKESGYDWVLRTLGNRTDCYKMFRMYPPVFHKLRNMLVESYGLKSTKKMSSVESLALFLWKLGAPQSVRQVENRFVRSMKTVTRKFEEALICMVKLSIDIIKPRDPEFRVVHERLRCAQWYPWFNDCIGAIDGTHVPVVVSPNKVPQYLSRHGFCSQNVMAVCDLDMRFTFVLAG